MNGRAVAGKTPAIKQLLDEVEHDIIHLMYGPEGNSFIFLRESRDEVKGNIRTRGKSKLTSFPRGIFFDFHIAKTTKQRRRAGNNCAIVSRSGYI